MLIKLLILLFFWGLLGPPEKRKKMSSRCGIMIENNVKLKEKKIMLVKNIVIADEIQADIMSAARGSRKEDFEDFVSGYGWKSWMQDFTSAAEGEPASEQETEVINEIISKVWAKKWEHAQDVDFYEKSVRLVQNVDGQFYVYDPDRDWNGEYWSAEPCDSDAKPEKGASPVRLYEVLTEIPGEQFEKIGYDVK